MLKNNLYTISSLTSAENGKYNVQITLNTDHSIFKGHFQDQPILPGVCLLEMVKEILMEIKQKPFRLTHAQNIKFLRLVDPTTDSELTFEMDIVEDATETKVNVNSSLKDGSSNFKVKCSFA